MVYIMCSASCVAHVICVVVLCIASHLWYVYGTVLCAVYTGLDILYVYCYSDECVRYTVSVLYTEPLYL